MEIETTLAQSIRITDGESKYDEACKRLLSEKPILARIMKAVMPEYQDCGVDDIAQKYIEGTPEISTVPVLPDEKSADPKGTVIKGADTEDKSLHEGIVNYDIRFHAVAPKTGEKVELIVNVEAQNDFYPGYPLLKRCLYYCCRMISSQYGREFTDSHYGDIQKVYSVWICLNPPQKREHTITRYRLVEERLIGDIAEPVENYDLLSAVILCLGDPDKANYASVLRMLDVLLSDEMGVEKKRQILQDEFDIPMTRTIEEGVSDMCNLSQGVLNKGIQQGLQQGLLKGRAEGIFNLVRNMGLSVEQAMDALGIAPEERETYKEMLKEQPS